MPEFRFFPVCAGVVMLALAAPVARAEGGHARSDGAWSQGHAGQIIEEAAQITRHRGGAGTAAGRGSLAEILNQYNLPGYIGGYNKPPDSGAGSLNDLLGRYNLPGYIGGYNQPLDNGAGSIRDAIRNSGFALPGYPGGAGGRR